MTKEIKKQIDHCKVDTMTDPELEGLFSQEQMKGLIDMLWNKGQKELEETNTWPSFRGRFTREGSDYQIHWVYNHQAPTPILAILTTKQKSDEVWAIIKSDGGEGNILSGKFEIDQLVKESKEIQAAYFFNATANTK